MLPTDEISAGAKPNANLPMKVSSHIAIALAVTLLFSTSSCDKSADDAGNDPQAPTVSENQPEPEEETEPAPRKRVVAPVGVCAIISIEEVSEITAQPYDTALSMAAFPDLSHCEYRQQKHAVSLLIEAGEAALGRLTAAKQGAAKPVEGFEEDSVWEPHRGVLTTLSAGRCVEVIVSPEHGEATVRLEQAKTLAKLLLSRSSMKPDAAPAPEPSVPGALPEGTAPAPISAPQ